MAGLGQLLAGAGQVLRGINDGNDEQDARDYTRVVRESGVKRMAAEDSTLPDRTEAARAAARLGTARDTAATGRVAGDSRLAETRTNIDQKTADHTLGHLGTFFNVADNELGTKLNASKVALEQSKVAVDQLPAMIAQARAKSALTDLQTSDMLTAGFMHAMQIGDKAVALKYVQGVADSGIFPQLKGAKIGDIGHVPDPKDPNKKVIVVHDDAGNPLLAMDPAVAQAAFSRINPAEWKVLGDGGSLVKVQGGQAVEVVNNPKDMKPSDRVADDARRDKNTDMRMQRGKGIIDSYFKSNTLTGLDPASQPAYIKAVARMGELVRGGTDPEAAAKKALDDVSREKSVDDVTKGGGSATGGKDFSKIWGGSK